MRETRPWSAPGFTGLILVLIVFAAGSYLTAAGIIALSRGEPGPFGSVVFAAALFVVLLSAVPATGLMIVQPNQARAVVLLGRYLGVVRESGWWFTVPFTTKPHVSLRVRNFNSERLKVNDVKGNPIEIAAVVVWRVVDAAKALFEVDQYEEFVTIQSETALRHIASLYPYDTFEPEERSLRGDTEAVSRDLAHELGERLHVAGVEVLEARLTHLAYAPEIAGAMLQRQQAEAVVAARAKIVEGAVGMVQTALQQLQETGVIELDDERKATMINNLMVAIVSDRAAQPVLNAGTIY